MYLAVIEYGLVNSRAGPAEGGEVHALVLMKSHLPGEYRRVGGVRLLEDIMRPWNNHRDFAAFWELDSEDYLREGENPGHYVYRIV